MRLILWKILLPVLLLALDAWWLARLNAGDPQVLKELGDVAHYLHFPLGWLTPWWVTTLSGGIAREGWALLLPMLVNTALLGWLAGAWIDWRLAERALGRRGPVDSLLRQFGNPSGFWGGLVAMIMNRGNRRMNWYVMDAAAIQAEDKVLDVGFGGGVSFKPVLAKLGIGSLTGVDQSESMVARARRKFSRQCASGRLTVVTGSVDKLPFRDDSFDKVITSNTIYFWPDLTGGLREIRRVLKAEGILALGMRGQEVMSKFRDFGFRAYTERQVAGALFRAGFNKIEVEDRPDATMGAKIFRAWSVGKVGHMSDAQVEELVDQLELNLGTLLDLEV